MKKFFFINLRKINDLVLDTDNNDTSNNDTSHNDENNNKNVLISTLILEEENKKKRIGLRNIA